MRHFLIKNWMGTILIIFVFGAVQVNALTTEWIGSENAWRLPQYWTSGVPGATTDAIVNNYGKALVCTSGQSCKTLLISEKSGDNCSTVEIQYGGSLAVGSSISDHLTLGNFGKVHYLGGSLNVAGKIECVEGNGGMLIIDGDATGANCLTVGGDQITADNIVIGSAVGLSGKYQLTAGKTIKHGTQLVIGSGGTGEFIQTGGNFVTFSEIDQMNNVTYSPSTIIIGDQVGGQAGTGSYTISGGTLMNGPQIDFTEHAIIGRGEGS